MEFWGDEQHLCPCYKEFQGFQKLKELKDSGLVIYCHRPRKENIRQAEEVESAGNTSKDVFIIYNKKNMKVSSSELTAELEKENISCPRCRKTFEHAQELMQKVKSIYRKTVMGICDQCRKKAQRSKKPPCVCDKIVKKFISDKQNQKAYSDSHINRGVTSPVSKHEPKVQQMFLNTHSKLDGTELSKTNLKEGYVKQVGAFIQPIEPVKTSSAHKLLETSVGVKELPRPKDRRQGEIFEGKPSMDAKEALKRKHDLSLRQMMEPEKESEVPYSVSKRPEPYLYETPVIKKKAKLDVNSSHLTKNTQDKFHLQAEKVNTRQEEVPYSVSKRPEPYIYETPVIKKKAKLDVNSSRLTKNTQDKFHLQAEKVNTRQEEVPYSVSKRPEPYIYETPVIKKKAKLDVNSSHLTKNTQDKFHLQAEKEKTRQEEVPYSVSKRPDPYIYETPVIKKKAKLDVNSSHLTKNTQDKFHLQAEKEKTRQEEGRQKLALEEKRGTKATKEAEEKQNQVFKGQKKYEDEPRKLKEKERKYEEDPKKLSEHKKINKNDLESKTVVVKEKKQNEPRRDTSKEKDGEIISQSKLKGKISKAAKKPVMPKPDPNELLKKQLEKLQKENLARKHQAAKDRDEIHRKKPSKNENITSDEILVSISKIQETLTKPVKEVTAKIKQKKDEEPEDTPLKKRQLETLQKENLARKHQAAKDRDEIHRKKPSKNENITSDEILVSISKIQKTLTKPVKEVTAKIKQKKDEEPEDTPLKKRQLETLQKENLARKHQAAKDRDEIHRKKPSKNENITSDEILVSISKIQKTLTKPVKEVTAKIKQKKDEEPEDTPLKKRQLETLQKENLARKHQAAKDRDEIHRKKPSKNENITSDEILVSISKIQKTLTKPVKEVTAKIKQKKDEEPEDTPLKKRNRSGSFDLQKLQAAHLKIKAEALNKNKQLEYEAQVAREEAERKAKTEELERQRMQKERYDDNLDFQASKVNTFEINPELLNIHKCNHQHSGKKPSDCPLCADSDLELEVLSLDDKKKLYNTDIIIGEKIFKFKPRLENIKEPEDGPILFQKEFRVETHTTIPKRNQIRLAKIEMEPDKDFIHYALSDRTFIDKGWTMLPTEKVVRKMNVYRMRPAHPEFDWFEHNKNKQLMSYDTGEKLAEFDDNGRGRWYYRNGRLALDYYNAEETNAQQRFVVYSSGEPDERGRTHPITILATFDYLGNGIVFDHAGKIRLKYNQTEGVVLDRGIGPISHWKWHSLNDPPVLQQVMVDTQLAHKDPAVLELGSAADRKTPRPDNEEMLAIEFDNFIKEKSKKLSQKFKPFQIKMKALKINEHFSLKVLDQATVYLIFRDGSTNLKLNIGMVLDHQEIVDTDTAEVGEVSNSLERFPACTDSLVALQRSVAHAQRYERQHAKRERWLRPPVPCASSDHRIAAASPPMRLPLRTVPTGSSSCTGYCRRKSTNNLYYDTRLRS